MGRTNPTFRNQIRQLRQQWNDYGRALRYDHRDYFDQLWADAENHADAAGYLNPDDPMVAVLFSICLEQERKIHKLEQTITASE